MAEQIDTSIREVLSEMSQANSVRLLPWFLSTAAKPGVGSTHSVDEVLTFFTTPKLEETTALASISSTVLRVSTLPPVPLASDIPAARTPVGQLFFTLALGLKCKKWDCSPDGTPEGQSCKRAHTGTGEGSVSSGCSTPPNLPVASHGSEQLEPEIINLPSSPAKVETDPNDRLAAEAAGSTIDCDRDSVVEASRDDADQSGDESDSTSDLLGSAADSGPKSATGDCHTCSDTEEVAVNPHPQKFPEESYSPLQLHQGLPLERGPTEMDW